jgi:hypothetical protein
MSRKVATRARASKAQARQLAGKNPPGGGSISPMLLTFQRIFENKTALELALRTGADLKHCEKCLAGTRSLGSEFQQRLLQSDVGREILIALMGDAKPAWWVSLQRQMTLSDLRRSLAEQKRQIEHLEEGGAQ